MNAFACVAIDPPDDRLVRAAVADAERGPLRVAIRVTALTLVAVLRVTGDGLAWIRPQSKLKLALVAG